LLKAIELSNLDFVIFDIETTGLYAEEGDEIIEIGAVRVSKLQIQPDTFQSLVNPGRSIPEASSAVHGIRDEDVKNAPAVDDVLPDFIKFCGSSIWVAQNARFDMSFILKNMRRMGLVFRQPFVCDTIGISKILFPYETRHNLDVMMARLGIPKSGDRHRSLDDCRYTAQVLIEFIKLLANQGSTTLDSIQSSFIKPELVLKTEKPKTRGLFA